MLLHSEPQHVALRPHRRAQMHLSDGCDPSASDGAGAGGVGLLAGEQRARTGPAVPPVATGQQNVVPLHLHAYHARRALLQALCVHIIFACRYLCIT